MRHVSARWSPKGQDVQKRGSLQAISEIALSFLDISSDRNPETFKLLQAPEMISECAYILQPSVLCRN